MFGTPAAPGLVPRILDGLLSSCPTPPPAASPAAGPRTEALVASLLPKRSNRRSQLTLVMRDVLYGRFRIRLLGTIRIRLCRFSRLSADAQTVQGGPQHTPTIGATRSVHSGPHCCAYRDPPRRNRDRSGASSRAAREQWQCCCCK
jgi:hypothetical protein